MHRADNSRESMMWGSLKDALRQMYGQVLQAIATYAQQLYQEKPTSAAPQPSIIAAQSPRAEVETGQLERMIDSLVHTGKLDPTMVQQLTELNGEATIDRVIDQFKANTSAKEVPGITRSQGGAARAG